MIRPTPRSWLRPALSGCSVMLLVGLAATTVRCEGLTVGSDAGGLTGGVTGSEGSCLSDVTVSTGTPAGGSAIGQACSPSNAPTNCADGTHIRFGDTGECVCIARCSSVGASLGEACPGGAFECRTVTGAGSTPYCIAPSWDVCGSGGTTGSDGTTSSDGSTGNDGSCLGDGASCTLDSQCCNGTCFAEGCG